MIGELIRFAIGDTKSHVRAWLAATALVVLATALFAVALGLGTAAAFTALAPEIGMSWTAALLAAVYLGLAVAVLIANRMTGRRRAARQLAVARARAASVPAAGPELMLLAAAAGALLSLGRGRATNS